MYQTSRARFIRISRIVFCFMLLTELVGTAWATTATLSTGGTGGSEAQKAVIITSRNMEADNRAHRAVFSGDVVADMEGTLIQSDRMEVLYNGDSGQVETILCTGGVKVTRDARVILSDEATYSGAEEKITFRGEPRIMEGNNLVTGTLIVYYPKADRLVVEDSRVYMQAR